MGEQKQVDALVEAIVRARSTHILSGSGVSWVQAWDELAAFGEQSGIPFYTTPQGRGVLPDDHLYSYLTMRSSAFRDADLIIIVGTRMNYIIGHAASPRFAADATIARIDVDAEEIATAPRRVDIPIVGDCKMVLPQVLAARSGRVDPERFGPWRRKLADGAATKRTVAGGNKARDAEQHHTLRLCEEIKSYMRRTALLV